MRPVLIGAVLMVLMTVALHAFGIDLAVAEQFYVASHERFPLTENETLVRFDSWAPVPGLVLGIGGLVLGLAAYIWKRSESWLRSGIFLALVLAIGPGLLVNGVKGFWGRPRPLDLQRYGGQYEYQPVWSLGADRVNCKSFPSGHGSMGFYLLAPLFLCRSDQRGRQRVLLAVGLGCGLVFSASRIIQGAHFVSDVMWSAGLVLFCCAVLKPLILKPGTTTQTA